jgi:hypothetical protein
VILLSVLFLGHPGLFATFDQDGTHRGPIVNCSIDSSDVDSFIGAQRP